MADGDIIQALPPDIIDTQAGLRMAAGNIPLYVKLLKDYYKHYNEAFRAISDGIASGDIETAHRLAHSLKNISGMVGAGRMQKAAMVVEKALADSGCTDDQLGELNAALTAVMGALAGLADASGAGEAARTELPGQPAHAPAASAPKHKENIMGDEEKYCIMIADDDKVNLDVLNSILMTEYDVRVFRSGKALLDQVMETPPDLILLDVMMPGLTGFQVLTKLKEAEATRRIPVIFLTGLDGEGYEEKGLRLGAVDYISKPFNHGIVLARIRSQIQIIRYIREIERLGMIDALTDIPNRHSFEIRVHEEWRRECRSNGSLAIMMLDIDKFRDYNETYGRPQGDELLRHVAAIINMNLRRSADFVARIGGEEFAIILPATNMDGAMTIAEKIRTDMKNRETSATISIGLALDSPTKKGVVEDLIDKANRNLAAAKQTGRDKVVAG